MIYWEGMNTETHPAKSGTAGQKTVDFATFLLAQSAAIRLAGHKDVTLTNKEISALFDCVPELRDFARNACT